MYNQKMIFKVISWNIWQDYHLKEVINLLKTSNADIIGLQEIIEKDGINTASIIAKELNYQYVYYRAIEKTRLGFPQGNAVLTKHKIVKSQAHFLSGADLFKNTAETEPRVAIESKIDIDGALLTFFTTHLAYSHKFRDSEFRNLQVDNLIKLLSHAKTILTGDFNSHPDSAYMSRLNKVMVSTDKDLTIPTWTMYPFEYEGFIETELKHRLDYIFVTKDIKVKSFSVGKSKGSDHLPIEAVVEL